MKNNCTYLTKDMNYYDDVEDIKCITASEAKYISSQALDSIKKKDLSNIMKSIYEAAQKGLTQVNYYEEINKISFNELKKLGYTISDNYNQRDGYCYYISWN